MNINYRITGKFKKVKNGLVDYIVDGELLRDGVAIPCEIGFTIWGYTRNNDEDPGEEEIEIDYIFIKEGVTADGVHYEAETIKL